MPLSIRRDDLLPGRNYIGRWCDAEEGRRFDVTDPATDAVVASVPDSGAADARAALEAAHAAFAAWRAVPAKQRAQILKRWNDLIVAHQEDLGRLISREQGKPLAEGRGEVTYAASYVEWFAEEATRANGDVIPAPVRGPAHVRAEGAGGRGRRDHAVELPGRDDRAQDRARAGRRLHGGRASRPRTRR